MRRLPSTFILCLMISTCGGGDALAQSTSEQSPPLRDSARLASVQVNDIGRRLPRKESEPEAAQPSSPEILPAPPLREAATEPFILSGVAVRGAAVFEPEAFAPLYDRYLARAISVKDVAEIAERITDLYRREGYFLARATVPSQDPVDGVLRINVAEGYIARVAVKGDAPAAVRRRLRELTEERPLKIGTLKRALALVGDLNGVTVTSSSLEPDPNDLAAYFFIVHVDVDHVEASLYADNRGTKEAGKAQTYARVAANSVLRTGDQLSLGLFTTPDDPEELILGQVSYQTPLTDLGAYATASGMISRFDAGASLAALDTESITKRGSIRFSYPFIRNRKLSLWGNVGFEARNIREEQAGLMQFEDKLRIVRLSTNYQHRYWNGATSASASISRGLNALDASKAAGTLSRPDANGEFTKLYGQLTRYQNIGQTFGVYVAVAGQWSSDPLLASEEFQLGGAQYGRAYDYAELSGDDGVAALIELRYGRKPDLSFLDFYQLYGFYDFGAVWNENVPPAFRELTLQSAGGGMRLTLPASLHLNFEAARPINRVPFTQNDKDWRGFFSVSKEL